MPSGLKLWGIITGTAIVLSDDSPTLVKAAARLAKVVFHDRIQICDSVDDQVEIQAAVDALPNDGTYSYGTVILLEGKYTITDVITVIGDVTIEGQGQPNTADATRETGTLIDNTNITGANAIRFHSGATHEASPRIRNLGIKGNTNSGHGIVFDELTDFEATNIYSRSNGGDGIHIIACWRGRIEYVEVRDNDGRGIALVGDTGDTTGEYSTEIVISHGHLGVNGVVAINSGNIYCGSCAGLYVLNCYFDNYGTAGGPHVSVDNRTDNRMWIEGSVFGDTVSAQAGIVVQNGCDCIITGNHFHGATSVPVWVVIYVTAHVTVSNNYFQECSGSAVNIGTGAGEVIISNNRFRINKTAQANQCAIVTRAPGSIIEGNWIISTGVGNSQYGIRVDGTNAGDGDRSIVAHNYIEGIHQDAIRITAADRCQVTNNTIRNATRYGVYFETACTNTLVEGNIITGSGTAAIFGASATDIISRQYSAPFMDIQAVTANYVVAAEDLTAAPPITCTLAAQPDVPRNITIAVTDGNASISAFQIDVVGVDAKGNAATEQFLFAGGLNQTGNVAWATITSIIVTSITGADAGDVLDVGIGSKLGLANVIYATGDVYKATRTTGGAPAATAADYSGAGNITVDATYHTVDVATGAGIVAGDCYIIWYRSNLNIIS